MRPSVWRRCFIRGRVACSRTTTTRRTSRTESDVPLTPVLATLGYVVSPDGHSVLLIHRDARPDDPHFGKHNGLGGKLERDEGIVAGMRREIREEAGIECDRLVLRGTISWP